MSAGRQLELVPTEELRGQLTIAGALEELPTTVEALALLATATGRWHVTKDGSHTALCGTDTALPLRGHAGLVTEATAVLLNDRHLSGGPVCKVCRAKVNVAAMTGAQL